MDRHNEALNLNPLKGMWQGLWRAQQKAFLWQQSRSVVTRRPRWFGMRLEGPTEGSDAQIPLTLRRPASAFYLSESPPGSKKVVFCKSLQLKSLSQTIPAHCIILSCVACHWKGGVDLIMWTELLLAPFDGLLPPMRIAYLSHCMTQSTNTKVSQVWKHKSKSQGTALLSVLCLLHSQLGVMANDCSWKGTLRYCRLAACWAQRGAGSKCFIQPNPVGICWSSNIVLLTQEDVITAEYEGVNTLWNTVLAVMQTTIVLFEMQYQQCWLTR